jgi:hypothetical protein
MATKKKTATRTRPPFPGAKPTLGVPDSLDAARETARHMAEGNRKLCLAVEGLRKGLEVIAHAEWDATTQKPVGPRELRALAVEALDAYSELTGQNWRRNPLIGSRAGDRNLATLSDVE